MKFGELVGRAVRDATLEALRWQNGLEASYTRGVFHALGRYGVREADGLRRSRAAVSARRSRAAPAQRQGGVLRAAGRRRRARASRSCSIATRHGTLPASVARDALVQQAASTRGEPRRTARSLARVPRAPARDRCGDEPRAGRWQPSRSAGARSGGRADRAPSRTAVALGVAVAADLALGDPVVSRPSRSPHRRGARAIRRRSARSRRRRLRRRHCAVRRCSPRSRWGPRSARSRWRHAGRPGPRGRFMSSCSTACSPSAISCVTSGGWSDDSQPAISTGARAAIARLVGRDTEPHGCRGMPPRRGRKPQRKPDRRLHQRRLLVRACRPARPRRLQGGEHDGLHGGLQDRTLSALRLVRRPPRRRDELRAGAGDVAAVGGSWPPSCRDVRH